MRQFDPVLAFELSDRQTKLQKKLRSYRSRKTVFIFLAVISLLVVFSEAESGDSYSLFIACMLGMAAESYHLRIKLIENELSESPREAAFSSVPPTASAADG